MSGLSNASGHLGVEETTTGVEASDGSIPHADLVENASGGNKDDRYSPLKAGDTSGENKSNGADILIPNDTLGRLSYFRGEGMKGQPVICSIFDFRKLHTTRLRECAKRHCAAV
jgi:hypothetical protein